MTHLDRKRQMRQLQDKITSIEAKHPLLLWTMFSNIHQCRRSLYRCQPFLNIVNLLVHDRVQLLPFFRPHDMLLSAAFLRLLLVITRKLPVAGDWCVVYSLGPRPLENEE